MCHLSDHWLLDTPLRLLCLSDDLGPLDRCFLWASRPNCQAMSVFVSIRPGSNLGFVLRALSNYRVSRQTTLAGVFSLTLSASQMATQ